MDTSAPTSYFKWLFMRCYSYIPLLHRTSYIYLDANCKQWRSPSLLAHSTTSELTFTLVGVSVWVALRLPGLASEQTPQVGAHLVLAALLYCVALRTLLNEGLLSFGNVSHSQLKKKEERGKENRKKRGQLIVIILSILECVFRSTSKTAHLLLIDHSYDRKLILSFALTDAILWRSCKETTLSAPVSLYCIQASRNISLCTGSLPRSFQGNPATYLRRKPPFKKHTSLAFTRSRYITVISVSFFRAQPASARVTSPEELPGLSSKCGLS